MNINELYNQLYEARTVNVRCAGISSFNSLRTQLIRKHRLICELAGKVDKISATFSDGIATFQLKQIVLRNYEVIPDEEVCRPMEQVSKEGDSSGDMPQGPSLYT